jgi:tRNA1Val (adenine37-N6)-methyltransferase
MSTINPHYTFHYSQPEAYHFSHDSVFLSRRIFEQLADSDLTDFRGLDICSGSGIIGMDFLFHRREENQSLPRLFDFLEIQDSYIPHFEENVKRLGPIPTQLNFLNRNYDDLQTPEFIGVYDLILSNPPYFFTWQGKLSPSEFKNRCRFFIDSDLKNLLLGIASGLKPTGSSYLLLRDLPEHKWDVIAEARKICTGKLELTVLGDVRGVHFIRLNPVAPA